ncbi:MAG: carbonate dehydratase [Gammaproteobacteria bacterium RIFCSPHIGHO2_12_FULL_45_9]|nr:MAG: carbonate dehydratase [Gammaproteobacteria bacterium RIFCSPHIGHO2_12_FULL_45_9]
MKDSFKKILQGYQLFREKYVHDDQVMMRYLSYFGQHPQAMVVACCDSRVDPALLLQCEPGDLFVLRNVANIVPPYELDTAHHGTSAALEFGICYLNIKNLILLGHSQCGGIQALLDDTNLKQNDFISNWVSIIKKEDIHIEHADEYAKLALNQSYDNCLSFPWIKDRMRERQLLIHRWFFDIKLGQIFTYSEELNDYLPLEVESSA